MSAVPAPAGAAPRGVAGILLAAGRAERFGGDKLLARLPMQAHADALSSNAQLSDLAGECIGAVSCRHLLLAIPRVVAVVRPDDAALAAALGAAGARIVRCANADEGMGASLAWAVRETQDAGGWVVALADMPWILPATIARVAAAIVAGAPVAAPFHGGQRGHPVAFSATCLPALMALTGDEGAKSVVAMYRDGLERIDVDDAGILRDIDEPSDLAA